MNTLIQPDQFALANTDSDLPRLDDSERQELLTALRTNLSLLNELAIRYEVSTRPERSTDREPITTAKQVFDLFRAEMSPLAQEQVRVLLLDRKLRIVGQRTIYQGNAYSALVRIAEIFKSAIAESVPNVIVVHNHPSGDPTPSADDIRLTKDLISAGDLLAVEVLDHVVIGADAFASIKNGGFLD